LDDIVHPLILSSEAEADLASAKVWYDNQQPGLGTRFVDTFDRLADSIRTNPEMYAKEFEDLRVAVMRRFPYLVVYRIDDDQITVVAVYHVKRNPRG
jgi:plasmid stabilization system protein ParE